MSTATEFSIGERRYTSAGNVFMLQRVDGVNAIRVNRVGVLGAECAELWDDDVLYCWSYCQWDSLPLLEPGKTIRVHAGRYEVERTPSGGFYIWDNAYRWGERVERDGTGWGANSSYRLLSLSIDEVRKLIVQWCEVSSQLWMTR